MAYFRVCPDCGCHLDPGETCDCKAEREEAEKKARERGGVQHGGYAAAAGRMFPRSRDTAVGMG